MFFINVPFRSYIEGERQAVQDNWTDIANFNREYANTLTNMFTVDTYDARLNQAYDNSVITANNRQLSDLGLSQQLAAFPGNLAQAEAQSNISEIYAPDIAEAQARYTLSNLERGINANETFGSTLGSGQQGFNINIPALSQTGGTGTINAQTEQLFAPDLQPLPEPEPFTVQPTAAFPSPVSPTAARQNQTTPVTGVQQALDFNIVPESTDTPLTALDASFLSNGTEINAGFRQLQPGQYRAIVVPNTQQPAQYLYKDQEGENWIVYLGDDGQPVTRRRYIAPQESNFSFGNLFYGTNVAVDATNFGVD